MRDNIFLEECGPEAEWIMSTHAAAREFHTSENTICKWIRSGEVEGRAGDPSKPLSSSNPYRINRKSLDDALIKRGMHPDPWPDASVPEIVKPVPVLYSTDHLRSDQIGNVGEHLVAYYLSFAGASVSLVDRRGMDHFVRLTNGQMFALEVKTVSMPVIKSEKNIFCHFTTNRLDADWFSFLDLSTNIVIFRRCEDLTPGKYAEKIPHKFFTPFYMNKSLMDLFDYYGAEPDPVKLRAVAERPRGVFGGS